MTAAPAPLIWPGQRAFRSLAHADARELFRSLDARLDPRVALIGVRWDDRPDLPEIAVEPAAYAHAAAALTDGAAQATSAASAANPLLGLGPGQQQALADLRDAVQRGLAPFEGEQEVASFCSTPQPVGPYMVCVAIQFGRAAYLDHPRVAAGHEGLFDALLDAVIDEFLAECALSLTLPEMGRFGVLRHEIPDLMRSAGKKLMYSPGQQMQGMLDLYDICNMISTMRYEGADGFGGLLVAPHGHPGVRVALALTRPISLRDYRSVRKLLEISDERLHLLCADGEVYGFGGALDPAVDVPDGLFLVAFSGHHHWRLAVRDRVLMDVTYGQPQLLRERISYAAFRRSVEGTFPAVTTQQIGTLWSLVMEATKQRHGTMVVVSAGAAAEAVRLAQQGVAIEPTALSTDLMRVITAIDGAVLIDPESVCHAIGTILDGRASDGGDPSRGARYNSAIRYVASSEHAALAIVVSEDGMINVVAGS